MALSILPVPELREAAARVAAAALPIETASTLPVPARAGEGLEALVMFYRESGPPLRRVVDPPTHAMRLDASTGKILHFGTTTPERLGIPRPLVPVPGAGIPQGMTGMAFASDRQRWLEISREVWVAFASASGSSGGAGANAAVVKEYYELFLRITKVEVAPFYVGAAPGFFGWVRTVAGVP